MEDGSVRGGARARRTEWGLEGAAPGEMPLRKLREGSGMGLRAGDSKHPRLLGCIWRPVVPPPKPFPSHKSTSWWAVWALPYNPEETLSACFHPTYRPASLYAASSYTGRGADTSQMLMLLMLEAQVRLPLSQTAT